MITVALGAQWSDEGKGKIVDALCQKADVCARCAGGSNAGHTIVANGVVYDVHILPSGIATPRCINLIGSGVAFSPRNFFKELDKIDRQGISTRGRIFISDRAHIVFDLHRVVDRLAERELGAQLIGTTRQGIGPCYATKAARTGVRVGELFVDDGWESRLRSMAKGFKARYGTLGEYDLEAEIRQIKASHGDSVASLFSFFHLPAILFLALQRNQILTVRQKWKPALEPCVVDALPFLASVQAAKKDLVVEGANAIMLDIDWGTYPFVTSSNTGLGGVITGLGIDPTKIDNIVGVMKCYMTKTGSGPFPTMLNDETGDELRRRGQEYGVTTGRKRDCGWLDLVVLRHSKAVNHYTCLAVTKLDILDTFAEIKVGVSYSYAGQDLPSYPVSLHVLENVEVEYVTLPGWLQSTVDIRSFSKLPKNARDYIRFIEDSVGVKVRYVGNGRSRADLIDVC